jgi:hypothetical protein
MLPIQIVLGQDLLRVLSFSWGYGPSGSLFFVGNFVSNEQVYEQLSAPSAHMASLGAGGVAVSLGEGSVPQRHRQGAGNVCVHEFWQLSQMLAEVILQFSVL